MTLSILETYKNKHILLTGGLGFLGKVLLTLMLHKIPTISKITIILRGKDNQTAKTRLIEAINTSPVFAPLHNQWKEQFCNIFLKKVDVITGDVSRPNFGIEDECKLQYIKDEVDLVINSAGLVSFNPELNCAIDANLKGAIHTAQFVLESKKAKLLHISTCFVAGNQDGYFEEKPLDNTTPNGKQINLSQEFQLIENLMKDHLVSKKESINSAIKQAQSWGWPNIYTYSKALSEIWLEQHMNHNLFTIVRPSIVESAIEFPFPGWNEGYNTTAPLIYASYGWYPFIITKNQLIVDVIPVDILCKQIIKIGATILNNTHAPVYQCGTSSKNPFLMSDLYKFSRKKQRIDVKNRKFKLKDHLKVFCNLRAITPEHPLSCFKLNALFAKHTKLMNRFKFSRKIARDMKQLTELYQTYLPFIFNNNLIFASELVEKIQTREDEFNTAVDEIHWANYWPNIHMEGIKNWCF